MVVSATAFKVAFSALVILFVLFLMDDANGTGGREDASPLWIAIPGALAGVVMVVAFVVGVLALIWGF